MSRPVMIENARIIDPASMTDATGTVLIEEGRIAGLTFESAPQRPAGAEVIDAGGLMLAPGLVDMRVFVGEPGKEYRETLASAGRAAVAGGVTSFLMMPNTTPAVDDGALVDFLIRRAAATSPARILPAGAITRGCEGKELTEFGLLAEAGAVCLSDGTTSIQSSALLRAAFSYAATFGLRIVHHVADAELVGDGVMNEGLFATVLGLKGIPSEAETIPLARDLQLALLTGADYHVAQISVSAAASFVRDAKRRSPRISAGISINNLTLNENDVGRYRTYFRLSTPLRREDDRLAMVEALRSGVLDVIHSDHDPQDTEVKRQPFAEASDGAVGLETLLAAALRLVHNGEVDLMTVMRALTYRPAQLLGLEAGRITVGAPADLILVDLDYPWQVKENSLRSRSRNTPFEGARLAGKVMRTWVGGETVFRHVEKDGQ